MKEKKEMLFEYMKANVAPILVDFLTGKDIENSIILSANIDVKKLNGHYEEMEFMPPKWYEAIRDSKDAKVLVIDKIDSISKEEQLKFCEILEHRKISTFELPDNCVIVVTADKVSKDTISEEILSLVACI